LWRALILGAAAPAATAAGGTAATTKPAAGGLFGGGSLFGAAPAPAAAAPAAGGLFGGGSLFGGAAAAPAAAAPAAGSQSLLRLNATYEQLPRETQEWLSSTERKIHEWRAVADRFPAPASLDIAAADKLAAEAARETELLEQRSQLDAQAPRRAARRRLDSPVTRPVTRPAACTRRP